MTEMVVHTYNPNTTVEQQGDLKFKVILSYIATSRPPWAMTCLTKKFETKNKFKDDFDKQGCVKPKLATSILNLIPRTHMGKGQN